MKNRPIQIGDVYQDKDKRMEGRLVKVYEINGLYARCGSAYFAGVPFSDRTTRISLHNLQTRFTLVEPTN